MTVKRKVWKEKFGEWFRDIIDRAGILDYRYPVKGCGVWLPYGFRLRKNIMDAIRKALDETGHEEMLFPTLIPEDLLAKESTHIRSFEGEALWITHGGDTPLNVKLVLRPTSETVITPMVKLWVRSHADLPRKVYQIGSIFRYETKATRPLIRVREVTTFKEAHTFHATHEDSIKQVYAANDIYKKIFDGLCIPYMISRRPEWDKFAGALTTFAFDTIFPDGKSLQIGTTHDLGQNFAKAFDLTFETSEGKQEFAWQTSYGISERAIAAVIAVHGDDRGLVLPPKIAPIQIVIIPIPYKGVGEEVGNEAEGVKAALEKTGFRVEVDDRVDITPGSKFYEWELKGVPVRVEIGPQDLKRGDITFVRRDTLERSTCRKELISEYVQKMMSDIEKTMMERAWEGLEMHTHKAESLVEAKKLIDSIGGIVETPWCGDNECGLKMEMEVDARILGTPADMKEEEVGICPICGRKGRYVTRITRTY